MSEGHRKGHLVAGVLAAVGLGGLRLCDDLGRAGARVARSADELGALGARAGDELRGAGKLGGANGLGDDMIDGVGRVSGAMPSALDEGLAGGSRMMGEGIGSDLASDIAQWSVELGLEAQAGTFSEDVVAGQRDSVGKVACPGVFDLKAELERWRRFVDEGFGAACAPNLVHGVAQQDDDGLTLLVGDAPVRLGTLAAQCWSRGSTCVFMGCFDGCSDSGVQQAQAAVPRGAAASLSAYTNFTAFGAASAQPSPAFVAVVRGDGEPGYTVAQGHARPPTGSAGR